MVKSKLILLFLCLPIFSFSQEWKKLDVKDDNGSLTGEKKWVYKVNGKFKDYDERAWNEFPPPEIKIKPLEVSIHVWENGVINFYFNEKNENNPSTFLTEEKSNPITKKTWWTLNVKTSKNEPASKFVLTGCWGRSNCLYFSYPSQQKTFLNILKSGRFVCQIEHEKREYIWPVTKLKDSSFTQESPTYKVGDIVPELGGIVFYIDSSGKHGLVAAEMDQGAYPWGCTDVVIDGSNSEVVFGGKKNTKDIIEGCIQEEISAIICDRLLLNDFDDWYLPSKDELNLMYVNLYEQGLGNFKNTWYHSSTQNEQKSYFSNNFVWHQKFDREGSQIPAGKKVPAQVRAVRSF